MHYKWKAFISVALCVFMGTTDSGMVTIAFPAFTQIFGVSPEVVLWVLLAYSLTLTGILLTVGRLADMLGQKRVFCAGFVVFTLGLGLCAMAQNIEQLLAFRVIQAIGAAMFVALEYAILTNAFPAAERGRALGLLEAVVGMGLVAGPALGGILLDWLDWRAVFIVRLPVGVVGCVLAWLLLHETATDGPRRSFDYPGALTLFGGMVCGLLAVNRGQAEGWASPFILGLEATSLILLALFVVVEMREADPVVDLRLFRRRPFGALSVVLLTYFVPNIAVFFLVPFYLIQGLGLPASLSGLLSTIPSLMVLLMSPISGSLSDRLGSWLMSWGGLALFAVGIFLLSRLDGGATPLDVAIRLGVIGLGSGIFMTPTYSAVMGSVPKDRVGTASAFIPTVRTVGMGVGLAEAGAVFAARRYFYGGAGLDSVGALVAGYRDTLLISAAIGLVGATIALLWGKTSKADVSVHS